jgi:hypothetical protein
MMIAHDTTWGTTDYEAVYAGTYSGKIYKANLLGPPFTLNLVYEAPGLESINAFTEIDLEVGDESGLLRRRKKKKCAKERRGPPISSPYMQGEAGGVISTIDNGLSWQDESDGLPADRKMSSIANHVTSGSTAIVYAGMFLNQNDGAPVYKLDFTTTGVGPSSSEIPGDFLLHQNYPNPFNPSTTITYSVSSRQSIVLSICDLLGREVATLVNETKEPGSYEATWDATGQASGMYFYRLKAGEFVATRKLVLVR